MATLSDANRAYIRLSNSDMYAPFLVDDPNLDVLYTQGVAYEPDYAVQYTIYYSIGMMINKLIAKECDLTEEARLEKLRQLDRLEKKWAQEAGIYGGAIRISTLDTGLDQEEVLTDGS